MVVNMKPIIMQLLNGVEGLKRVSPNYPKKMNTFPIAIYRTVSKPHFTDHDGAELETQWSIVVEIFTDTGSLTSIANEVESKFNKIGFSGNTKDANTADFRRVVCEFKAIVDNECRRVYRSK